MSRYFHLSFFSFIVLGFGLLFFDFTSINLLLIAILSFPLTSLIFILRSLSLYNPITNGFAWVVFILIGLIPLWISYRIAPKTSKPLMFSLSLITLSIFYYASVYGSLNYLFAKSMMPYESIESVLHFSISIIIIGLVSCSLIIANLDHLKRAQTSFRILQWIVFISAMYLAFSLFLPYSTLINTWSSSLDDYMNFYNLVFSSWISLVIIHLFRVMIQLIETIRIKTFSYECIHFLTSLKSSSMILFFSSLIGPIFFGILNFVFYQSLNHVSISITFPWFEMVLAILVIAISTILSLGIKTTQENEGFI
jgi:hypothetical protein